MTETVRRNASELTPQEQERAQEIIALGYREGLNLIGRPKAERLRQDEAEPAMTNEGHFNFRTTNHRLINQAERLMDAGRKWIDVDSFDGGFRAGTGWKAQGNHDDVLNFEVPVQGRTEHWSSVGLNLRKPAVTK